MKTFKLKAPRIVNEWGVPNQFVIYGNDYTAFQSYDNLIAVKQDGKMYLNASMWDYSKTTGKYRNHFLGLNKKETEVEIKAGTIILVNMELS